MSAATVSPPVRTSSARARRPNVRTFRVVQGNPPTQGRVMISVDATNTLYEVGHLPLDPAFGPGLAFLFRKLFLDGSPAGEGYHLTYHTPEGEAPVIDCDCPGHRHYRHCRLADCLLALLKRSSN